MNEHEEIQKLKAELAQTKLVLGTLITWLNSELGSNNVITLLDMLDKDNKK